jgi:sugar phosphate isomerase/epimerase
MGLLPSTAINRRQLLQTGLIVAGGMVLKPGQGRGEEDKGDVGDFKFGAQSYTFRNFDTEAMLKRVHDLGLHHVELYQKHCPAEATPDQLAALLKLCGEYDIFPVGWGVQHFTKDIEASRKYFELGKKMRLKYLSASPEPDSFDALDKLVEEYQIAIAIHPHGPVGNGRLDRWYSAEVIMAAVKDHHPLIGSCLDTGHLIRAAQLGKKLDPAEQVRIMGARNFAIHLKDHDNAHHTDVIFGKGALDVPAVLKALQDVKFKGTINIEYEAHPEDPMDDVKGCLAVDKEAVKNLG